MTGNARTETWTDRREGGNSGLDLPPQCKKKKFHCQCKKQKEFALPMQIIRNIVPKIKKNPIANPKNKKNLHLLVCILSDLIDNHFF